MKVSVIMPAFNRAPFIGSALNSLLRQSDQADLDILVVDDGSTDGTRDIVAALAHETPVVRLISGPKSGVARARNIGIDNIHPQADFVTFLDSDDISVPGRFASEIPVFADRPQLAMTYSLMTLTDGIDDEACRPTPSAKTCTLRGISLTTALFRREAIARIGRFCEDFVQAEDMDYLLRFFESGLEYELIDTVSILYRRHPGNTTRNRHDAKRYIMKAVLASAGRKRRGEAAAAIPKFFEVSKLYDAQYAALI